MPQVIRLFPAGPALAGRARSPAVAASDRSVRVVAAFVRSRSEADELEATLLRHLDLHDSQVVVLSPQDADATRYAAVARRWDRLRPGRGLPPRGAVARALASGAGAAGGLVLAAGLLDIVQAADLPWASAAGLLGGAALGLLAHLRASRRAVSVRRFDRVVQKRLRAGLHAVTVTDVAGPLAASVVEALQAASVYWCAEAPGVSKAPAAPRPAPAPPAR